MNASFFSSEHSGSSEINAFFSTPLPYFYSLSVAIPILTVISWRKYYSRLGFLWREKIKQF